MIGRPFARNRWAIAGLAATAGIALALACEAPTPTSERQLIKPNDATKTLTVAPLMKVKEDCTPAYVLNGKAVPDKAIAVLTPGQISSINVYKGARAIEEANALHLDAGCGVIKVYTNDVDGAGAVRERELTEQLAKQYKEQQNVAGGPTFTPFTVRPELLNKDDVVKAINDLYPPLLREAGIDGTTKVWLYIDRTGKVMKVQMNETSGRKALDEAALRVAGMMQFKAALNRDKAVPVWVSIPIVFQH